MSEGKPLTQQEVEKLAAAVIGQFLTDCRIAAGDDERAMIGNCLMKLCSVAGVIMAHAEGSETAFDRLLGTAQFIVNKMPREPARMERLQ